MKTENLTRQWIKCGECLGEGKVWNGQVGEFCQTCAGGGKTLNTYRELQWVYSEKTLTIIIDKDKVIHECAEHFAQKILTNLGVKNVSTKSNKELIPYMYGHNVKTLLAHAIGNINT